MVDPDFPPSAKGRRYQPTETKQRIIDAARRLFMDKGYTATSTADLAVAADVAEGSIFYHFGSKRALLEVLGKIYAQAMVVAMMGDAQDVAELDPGDMVARCFDYCQIAGDPKHMIGVDPHSGESAQFELAARDVVLNFVAKVMAANFTRHGMDTRHVHLKAAMSYAAVHDALMRAHQDGVSASEYDMIKIVAIDYIRGVASFSRKA
jgi:AcrR family transcriptional regulator